MGLGGRPAAAPSREQLLAMRHSKAAPGPSRQALVERRRAAVAAASAAQTRPPAAAAAAAMLLAPTLRSHEAAVETADVATSDDNG